MAWGSSKRRGLPCGVMALAMVSAGLQLGCAKRTDERVRAAWGGSNDAPQGGPGWQGTDREGPGGDGESERTLTGWARLDQILDGAVAEAALGTDDEVLARLAERWCATEPEPLDHADGPIMVCIPSPPVTVDGTTFTLELGGEGVIGLVANELSAGASTSLVSAALDRLERWCTDPWTDVSPRPQEPKKPPATAAELHTCPVEGSALLVVARFASDPAVEQWQVSVAVIDAS